MTDRRCFLTHFILCLGIAAGAFLAWVAGLPTMIWAADASHMTSAIAALFVVAAFWIGRQAWSVGPDTSTTFGHLTVRLSPMLGILGTAVGLSMQAASLAAGSTSFVALATSLYTTACGMLAALLLELLTHNLETGIEKARRHESA